MQPFATAVLTAALLIDAAQAANSDAHLLVFSKTAGFRHTSIEPGIAAIESLAKANGFTVRASEDARLFTPENLAGYAAVIFLSTTGNVLDESQQRAFENYIEQGGGFVGVHAAADTEYEWAWYGELVGAWFLNHGPIHDATLLPTMRFGRAQLPARWERRDEWYNFKQLPTNVAVILKLDTETLQRTEHHGDHPIAWYHRVGQGRAFYTGLGHTDESFSEPLFLAHLLDGIRYAIGRERTALE